MDLKRHELSACYPTLSADQLQELADDIKANGQYHPIELYKGEIIDGWNRYLACQLAKVEPWTIDETSNLLGHDLAAYVFSTNGLRRHLSIKDRAIAAAKLAKTEFYKNRAKSSQARKPMNLSVPAGTDVTQDAAAAAARDVGVSERSVKRAVKALKDGSTATKKALEAGDLSLPKAESIAKLPKADQAVAVKEATTKPKKDSVKPSQACKLKICRQAFGTLLRTSIKMGLDIEKFRNQFNDIIAEVERLGNNKAWQSRMCANSFKSKK